MVRFDLRAVLTQAELRRFALDLPTRRAELEVRVAVLDEGGVRPTSRDLEVCLGPVGRVAAYLRRARWTDDRREVMDLLDESRYTAILVEPSDLAEAVAPFRGYSLSGIRVMDAPSLPTAWGDQSSLDRKLEGEGGHGQALWLALAGAVVRHERDLDLLLWFDDVTVSCGGNEMSADDLYRETERMRAAVRRKLSRVLEDYLPLLRRFGDGGQDVHAFLEDYIHLYYVRDKDVMWGDELFDHHERLFTLWEAGEDEAEWIPSGVSFSDHVAKVAAAALQAFEEFITRHGS